MTETTEIRIDEHGDEVHESWLLIRVGKVQSTGTRLFDSEIRHQHYVHVYVTRCSRKRDLNYDRLHSTKVLLEMSMSQAQWGAFVSSFGEGSGVPATMTFLAGRGQVPQAPDESRLAKSHAEVREAGTRALDSVVQSYRKVMDVFEGNGGKRALRDALRDLGARIGNAPANMEFAAKSLTEHVETVVTKARADIEGMVRSAEERRTLTESFEAPQLPPGDKERAIDET